MNETEIKIVIVCDNREERSGIPLALRQKGVEVKMQTLLAGDYIVNNSIIVERKTKEDFVASLIGNRLFEQCHRLKKTPYNHIMIIEGNPYKTKSKISREAVKGALLSISLAWQIPTVFTSDIKDSVDMLIAAGNQLIKEKSFIFRKGRKPKAIMKKRLYLLQGLPMVGATIANSLLVRFGSIENVMSASIDELMDVDGIGKGKAIQIKEFITNH